MRARRSAMIRIADRRAVAVLVALAPFVVRSSWQGLLGPGAVVVAVAVVAAAVLPGRTRWVVPVIAAAVAWPTTVAGLAALAAASVVLGLGADEVVVAPASRRRDLGAAMVALAAVGGTVVMLTGELAVVPAAVFAVGGVVGTLLAGGPAAGATPVGSRRPPAELAVATVAVLLLQISGRPVGAVVLAAVVVVSAVASWRSLRWRRALDRARVVVRDGVTTVLTFVVLLPVHLLVLTPIGVVRRLAGRRRSAFGSGAAGESLWRTTDDPGAEPLDRMFLDQRRWRLPRPPRARAGVGRIVLAVLLVEAVIAGAVLGVVHLRGRQGPGTVTASDFNSLDSAALAGQPWVPAAAAEIGGASAGLVYTPYVGWSLRDYEGEYVNVSHRERRSYEPAVAPGTRPIEVWCFGGSTMFGYDLQRDEHTIPSELARLAERDGITLRVRNFGSPGYVSYQSAVLFSLLLTSGRRPDLAVFYDGLNDTSLTLLDRFAALNPAGEPADLYAHVLRQSLAASRLVPDMSDDPPSPLGDAPPSTPTAHAAADQIVSVYRQAVDLAQALGTSYDVPVVHAWQPDAFTKADLDPGEEARLEQLGVTGTARSGMTKLSIAVRSRFGPDVLDLSSALDGVEGPVLSDTVHLNERGAAAVAGALYEQLAPQLRDQNNA